MKIVCVSDHFMEESFYLDCLKQFPEIELISIPYFGAKTRKGMREIVDKLEKEGAYSYPAPKELIEAVKDADLLMVHLCPVPKEVLDAAPNLKYVLSNRGGLENLDLQALKERGIPVLYNPAHNGNAVAELTICLMICETRNVARANSALKAGEWRENYPNVGKVFELRHKTIGLIGFGTIGRLVAEKLQPFHVNILTSDPNISPEDPDLAKYNVTLTDQETLLKESDIVSLHARTVEKEIILSEKDFAFTGGKLTALVYGTVSSDSSSTAGVKCGGNCTITDGTIGVNCSGEGAKAINADGNVVIDNGCVTLLNIPNCVSI